MLDAVQAGARRKHPARKNPLHLALQRDLVDLDKGVGVGGFGGRTGVAGVGLDPQRAELDGLADILVEIDDAPGDLVEAGEARLLVDDLLRRRLGNHLVAGLQRGRRLRHALGLALSRRQSRQRIAARGRHRDALPGAVRRRDRNARRRVLRNHGGARRRRQRLRLHRAGRRHALPRRRTASAAAGPAAAPALPLRRRAAAAGCRAGYCPAAACAGSEKILPICARAGGASEIVEAATRAAKPVRAMVRNISRGFKGRIGLATLYRLIRRSQGLRLTRRIRRGKGAGFAATSQPVPQMK